MAHIPSHPNSSSLAQERQHAAEPSDSGRGVPGAIRGANGAKQRGALQGAHNDQWGLCLPIIHH